MRNDWVMRYSFDKYNCPMIGQQAACLKIRQPILPKPPQAPKITQISI